MASNAPPETKSLHVPAAYGQPPDGWTWSRLDDVSEGVYDCPHSTPKLTETGPFLVRTQDIITGVFRKENAAHVSEETYAERIARVTPNRGDLLYSREGTYFGIAAEMPANTRVCLGQRMVLIRPDKRRIDFSFLRHWLNSPIMAAHIHGYRDGTVAERLNLPTIRALPVLVPPLAKQKAIATVLGALDDKIELNRRMNVTMERMARSLFQSWFVDFDPVRAKLDSAIPAGLDPKTSALFPSGFQNSLLGLIPQGWEVVKLGQCLDIQIGGDWGNDNYFDGAVEVLALRGVDLDHLRARGDAEPPRRWVKESSLAKRRMTDCDVLIAGSGAGPCGRPLWVSPHLKAAFSLPLLYSNFCKRFRAKTPEHAIYFDRLLFGMRQSGEIWDYINGTSLPNLDSNGLLTGKLAVVPPFDILKKFSEVVGPIYEQLYSRQTRNLATLRNTLLPKLLNGELSVAEIKSKCD